MNDKELNITLREMARSCGLCDEWYGQWKDDSTIDECLERYIKGFDFAVKNNWPSLEFSRKNFRKEDLHRHNIYLDDEVDITDGGNGYYVLVGRCTGHIDFKGFKAATVYVRHDSRVTIRASEGARIMVRCYESCNVDCQSDNVSKVVVIDRRK